MSYQEWLLKAGLADLFQLIIDRSWSPAEQSELARLWKAWAPE